MAHDEELRRSWERNAAVWADAVRTGAIASRRQATDAAVVEAVMQRGPARVLDVGCGEGWLARALHERGVEVVGVDASLPLVEAAREAGGGAFLLRSYAQVAAEPEALGGPFDVVVCNFALLDEDLAPLLRALQAVLGPGGALVIQTVHPWLAGAPYRDGWRLERFAGFGGAEWSSMPWHFRTLSSWVALLGQSGYALHRLREPAQPDTGDPLSLLMVAVPAVDG